MTSNDYMMGRCHVYAVALHRLFEWPLVAVTGVHEGRLSVFHVAAIKTPDTAVDARGEMPVEDLTDEQLAHDGSVTWLVPLAGEGDVWRMSVASDGYLNPMTEDDIEEAMEAAASVWEAREALERAFATERPWFDDEKLGRTDLPDLRRSATDGPVFPEPPSP